MPRILHRAARGLLRVVPPLRNWERLLAVMRSKHAPTEEEFLVRLPNGYQMMINPADYVGFRIYMCGYYEAGTVAAVERALRPGDVFFDIGSHFGQYSLVASRAVGSKGEVHSFEPGPTQFKYLTRNIELNQIKNVFANQLALSNRPGTMGFVIDSSGNLGGSHLAQDAEEQTLEVSVSTLNDYCQQKSIQRLDIVKMDVEGAERLLLEGAKEALTTYRPRAVFYEAVDKLTQRYGYPVEEVHSQFESLGYQVMKLQGPTMQPASAEDRRSLSDFVAARRNA